jgi:hypothetical protein
LSSVQSAGSFRLSFISRSKVFKWYIKQRCLASRSLFSGIFCDFQKFLSTSTIWHLFFRHLFYQKRFSLKFGNDSNYSYKFTCNCTCHIFETSLVISTFCRFYSEHIINFTPGKFQQILISRTITDNSRLFIATKNSALFCL